MMDETTSFDAISGFDLRFDPGQISFSLNDTLLTELGRVAKCYMGPFSLSYAFTP